MSTWHPIPHDPQACGEDAKPECECMCPDCYGHREFEDDDLS